MKFKDTSRFLLEIEFTYSRTPAELVKGPKRDFTLYRGHIRTLD